MFEDIYAHTILKDGDWIKRKNSAMLVQIKCTGQENIFEIVTSASTKKTSGRVTAVVLRGELVKYYQKQVG